MTQRLALGIIPGSGWRASEIRAVAQEAEDNGLAAIFAAEVNNDVLATAQLMGSATRSIKVGSWVANIYLRHPYLCAKHAALIADGTEGRMILGLGVSHQPVNSVIGVSMASPLEDLRAYTTGVVNWLNGIGPATHLPQTASAHPVPVYVGALTSRMVELAGELADGVMPLLWPAERVLRSKTWAERGRGKSPGRRRLEMALGIPVFIDNDVVRAASTARANLALFATYPFFQRLLRVSGFEQEAKMAEAGGGPEALSDRFLDAVCLLGPESRCRERLHAFIQAGVDLPILMPPIDVASVRGAMTSIGKWTP